jgi:hypothetical protein
MRRTLKNPTWDELSAVCRSLELERRYPSMKYDGDNGGYEPDFERRVAPLWDAGPRKPCPYTGMAQYETDVFKEPADMAQDLVLDMRRAGYPVEFGWYYGEDGGQNMLEVYVIEGAAVTEAELGAMRRFIESWSWDDPRERN